MQTDFNKLFLQNNSILLVVPPEQYKSVSLSALKQIYLVTNKMGYISLNKIINPLRKFMSTNGIDVDKLYFVDSVTKTVIGNPQTYTNCIYVPSPHDLTKMSIAITKMLKRFSPNFVIFDSVSTLLIYEQSEVSTQFLHSQINKISAHGSKSLFLCLQGNKEEEVIRSLSLIVDLVVKV